MKRGREVYSNRNMFTFFRRTIRFGWQNFWRESGLNIATVFVLTITISLVTFIFVSQGIVNHLIGRIQDKIDISVYVRAEADIEEINQAKKILEQLPEVQSVVFLSREEVLKQFEARHANDPVIMESLEVVGSNPFYGSLNIRAQSPDQYAAVLMVLGSSALESVVQKVDYLQKKTVIDKLSDFIANINTVGFVLALALAIVAVLVTFNTIRVAIHDSSKEISIMRLVGATNKFIRGPFIVQGVISGTIAAAISCLIFFILAYFAAPKIEALTDGFNIMSWWYANLSLVIIIQLFTGIFLGTFSGLIAIHRYLRV
jgi:cell division transport system permease protein